MKVSRTGKPDFLFLFLIFLLIGFGLVMVFSSSSMVSSAKFNSPWYLINRQIIWSAIGSAGLLFFMNFPYIKLQKRFIPIFVTAIMLLILVLFIGNNIKGHRSWFGFGSIGLQPTEYAKLALIIYLAALISKKGEKFHQFKKGLFPVLIIVALVLGLVMLQPDVGSSLIILLGSLLIIIAGGANILHLVGIAFVSSPIALYIVLSHSYRIQRFTAFLNPWNDQGDTSYQLVQSLFAFGHGGIMGVGIGRSIEKLGFLPESYNDFIFSIIGEELGFVGCLLFLLVFLLFLMRGLVIALRCQNKFGTLLGVGIISFIGVQALINIGGVTGSIPITGVTLPLISYGGSSLLLCMCSMGIILNISRENNRLAQSIPSRIKYEQKAQTTEG